MIPDIRKVQGGLEKKYISSRASREKELKSMLDRGDKAALVASVNSEGKAIAKEATDAYRDLGQYLFVKFMDGNMKKTDENGNFIKSEYGLLRDILRSRAMIRNTTRTSSRNQAIISW